MKKLTTILLSVLCALSLSACGGSQSSTNTGDVSQNQTQEQPIKYEAEFTSGYYTSGIDFPSGTYDITAIDGNGNVSSDNLFDGGINAVMGVDDDGFHEKEYMNIRLPENVVLQVSNGVTIKIHSDKASGKQLRKRDQPLTEEIELKNGYFISGQDFPAGVYDIIAVSGHGNVSSDNLFDGGINAVMGTKKSDFYEPSYKNVELPNGVELKVDGVKIKLVPSK